MSAAAPRLPANATRRGFPSAEERLATLRDLFDGLREQARCAESREELAELHRQAGYLVRLSRTLARGTPARTGRSNGAASSLPAAAAEEFARATDALNHRGRELGIAMDLSPGWTG